MSVPGGNPARSRWLRSAATTPPVPAQIDRIPEGCQRGSARSPAPVRLRTPRPSLIGNKAGALPPSIPPGIARMRGCSGSLDPERENGSLAGLPQMTQTQGHGCAGYSGFTPYSRQPHPSNGFSETLFPNLGLCQHYERFLLLIMSLMSSMSCPALSGGNSGWMATGRGVEARHRMSFRIPSIIFQRLCHHAHRFLMSIINLIYSM